MKAHRPLLTGVTQALSHIFGDGYYSDKVIERLFKSNPIWGARDRDFIASHTYEMTKHWRAIWWQLGLEPSVEMKDLEMLVGSYATSKGFEVPYGYPAKDFVRRLEDAPRAIQLSVPDWLDAFAYEDLGERWEPVMKSLNTRAPVVIRGNSLKTKPGKLREELAKEGVDVRDVPGYPDAWELLGYKNLFRTKAFQNGWFEVQDAASQKVAPYLSPQPGERIVDACAGAGGKSLHLAALMKNKGKILSLDIHDKKLGELRERASRAGVDIIETRMIEGSKTIKRLEQSFDAALMDVPCSGTGAFKRNPDSKHKLTRDNVDNLLKTQKEILNEYSKMVKPGGRMVYATCSVLRAENEIQVRDFLKSNPSWFLEAESREWPDKTGYDGFYMARLKHRASLKGQAESQ